MADGSIREAVTGGVLDYIREYIRRASLQGERGWRAAQHDEDTLTGHWGGALQTGWSEPVDDSGYLWRWRIDYRKFSAGNQKTSEEKPTGSDGIVQIEVERTRIETSPISLNTVKVENVEVEYVFRKGILFQAKRTDSTERKRLLGQLSEVEKLTPGNGSYFEYGPDHYRAALAERVLRLEGFTTQLEVSEFPRLGDFLADEFLPCKVGVEGMYVDFDSEPHELHFPTQTEDIKRVQAELNHGLRIKVTGFRMSPFGG